MPTSHKRQKLDDEFDGYRYQFIQADMQLPQSDTSIPLKWKIKTNGDEFLDKNIILNLGVRITREDGTPIKEEQIDDLSRKAKDDGTKHKTLKDNVGIINFPLATIFRSLDFQINGVSPGNNYGGGYGFWALSKAMINFNKQSRETLLKESLFVMDEVEMDAVKIDQQINKGLYHRSAPFSNGKIVEICGPLLADVLFNTSGGQLPPSSEYDIKLYRQPHEYCLMTGNDEKYKLEITKAELRVKKLFYKTGSPSAIAKRFKPISFIQSDVEFINVPTSLSEIQTYIFSGHGVVPKRLLIMQISQDARHGSYKKNPFNFKNFGAKRIAVTLNGVDFPPEEIKMDFANNEWKQAFFMVYEQLYGSRLEDLEGLELQSANWKNGWFIWPITPYDFDGGDKNPHMLISVEYDPPLSHDNFINLVVIAEYDKIITMNAKSGKIEIKNA
jgi:hypothetical protein